jgi:hypothetical protein
VKSKGGRMRDLVVDGRIIRILILEKQDVN